ncbi:DUF192 domain-containing protein [Actibacterium sp. MT2.3-13A]|uniref:DUF192 domain-containing protein n=1 Tax=Actibacterium sp. MT2.3-13A TaxID=2828332 RepID=UPI001BAB73E3|nr:DUF192 domain-containing protein [Actibacterium sp. MT2.3-13A]
MRRGVILLAALCLGAAPALACDPEVALLRGPWGQARFRVEVADDAAERAQGLMHRDSLGASRGMLFLYERPQRATFWMRNTLIPLDMIFLDAQGRVTRIHENARPLDETVIDGGSGVVAVLEINGGMARRIGVSVGSEMRHPFFGAQAAWPCAAP